MRPAVSMRAAHAALQTREEGREPLEKDALCRLYGCHDVGSLATVTVNCSQPSVQRALHLPLQIFFERRPPVVSVGAIDGGHKALCPPSPRFGGGRAEARREQRLGD